jgi:hypothetical protein
LRLPTLSITHRIKGRFLFKKFGKIFNFPELRARPFKVFFVFFQKQTEFFGKNPPKFGKIENFPELFEKKPSFYAVGNG